MWNFESGTESRTHGFWTFFRNLFQNFFDRIKSKFLTFYLIWFCFSMNFTPWSHLGRGALYQFITEPNLNIEHISPEWKEKIFKCQMLCKNYRRIMKNWIRQFKDIQNHNWHTSFLLTSSGTFFTVGVILRHPKFSWLRHMANLNLWLRHGLGNGLEQSLNSEIDADSNKFRRASSDT